MHPIVDQDLTLTIIVAEETGHAIRTRGRRQIAFVGQPPSEPLIAYGWKVVAPILQDEQIDRRSPLEAILPGDDGPLVARE
jgi:hypothetical protein